MPREISNSSIKTIWENNPDTPLTATNLSKALDLIASYKDYNVEYENQPLHKEYSLLAINPEDSSQLLFKRGSVLQIINEATDDAGEPVVPKNEHYKIFDVGLDDIILTSNETDRSLEGDKSVWGSNGETKKWFVFLCDKDDSTVYSKGTDSEYGGGAQIVISNSNEKPQNYSVPGRPYDLYTEDDTRIIGGFKTYNNTITEVWDISGRYYSVKSKSGYYILNEHHDTDDYDYRRIDVRDLNTDRNSVFEGSITVDENANLTGGLDLSGTVQIDSNNFKIDSTLGNASLHVTDTGEGLVDIKSNLSVEGDVNFASSDFTIVGDVKHYGSFTERDGDFDIEGKIIHKGDLEMDGDISQSGTVTMGGRNETLSSEGIWYHNGEFDHTGVYKINGAVEVSGSYSLISDALEFRAFTHRGWDYDEDSPIYHAFQIRVQNPIDTEDERTSSNADSSIYTYHRGRMEVYGATWSHSDYASFQINYDDEHKMIAYSKGFEYSDQGDSPSGGFKITSDLIVQNDSDNVLLNVKRFEKEVHVSGDTDVNLKYEGNTFTVSDNDGSILTVQKDPRNLIVSGDIEVESGKTITADYLDGNAKTATEFENLLTFNFDSSDSDMSSGSVEFSGSEGAIKVDLLIDRDKWYNIEDFENGALDGRYYTETELDPDAAQGDNVLDDRYYTEQEIDDRFGGESGTEWSVIGSRPVYTLQEEEENGDTTIAASIDLSENDNHTFSLNINGNAHIHNDIYYKTESDERYYTKEDLTNYTTEFSENLPTIHWDVLTNVPFGSTGTKRDVSREDHIHNFDLNLYDNNFSFGENTTLNLSNSYSRLDFLNPYSSLGINRNLDFNIEEDYLLFESYSGLIKFWFKDDELDNNEPDDDEAVDVTVSINVTNIDDSNIADILGTAIGDRPEFETEILPNDTIIVNYNSGDNDFIPTFNSYPYSTSSYINIGINSFREYSLNLMVDDLISETNHIGEDDNYILTKNLHDNLTHRVLGTNKENLLLDSSADFLNIDVTETDHPINTVYTLVKENARPSPNNDNSRRLIDKVGIHVNNIYIPSGFDPDEDDPTSVQSYLNVTSTLDGEDVTQYDIEDVPLLQYLKDNYPTRNELGGDGSLSDQYYLREVINPSISDPGSEASSETDVDWSFETNLDWRYYTEFEINPGTDSVTAASSSNDPDFTKTSPLDYRYYNKNVISAGSNITLDTSSGLEISSTNIYANSFELVDGELTVGYNDDSGGGTGLNFDDRYYTETEIETPGSSSINLGNLNQTEDTTINLDSGDLTYLFDSNYRKFTIKTDETEPSVSFDIVNSTGTPSYPDAGGYIDLYASIDVNLKSGDKFDIRGNITKLAGTDTLEFFEDDGSGSALSHITFNDDGVISFGDKHTGFFAVTLSESGVSSLDSNMSSTSLIGGINEAYNNVPDHNHDDDYQEKENGFVYARAYTDTTPDTPQDGDISIDTTAGIATMYINGTWVNITS